MNRKSTSLGLALLTVALTAGPAFAHHVMGGRTPTSFADGLLSGLGHPIIGLDHFAAVVAVGCLAAAHRAAPALVIGFVLAMIAGVAAHVQGASVPSAEILVATIGDRARRHAAAQPADAGGRGADLVRAGRLGARLCAGRVDHRRRTDAALLPICWA